ncbi:hypothetical protein FRC03_007704 [Tulasnella sp. 419]|nr:hypothetical protein FRC03_007704 [Tulasnella sp. 419]
MARLVGRSGGWSVGCVVRRYQGQSDDEYRKSLGYKPVNSGETSGQYADRMVGMLTLYAAILQTSPTPSISQGFAPPPYIIPAPYAFQLPRLWTLLSRILSTPRLLEDPSAPQILFGVIEIAGDRALSVYGKQFAKIRRMLMRRCLMSEAELNAAGGPIVGGAAGKDGVASRMRLGLALEKWDKGEAPKIGPDGREMNP